MTRTLNAMAPYCLCHSHHYAALSSITTPASPAQDTQHKAGTVQYTITTQITITVMSGTWYAGATGHLLLSTPAGAFTL